MTRLSRLPKNQGAASQQGWRTPLLLAAVLSALLAPTCTRPARAGSDCPDAQLLGPNLLTSICWDCIFPIRLAGATLALGAGDIPDKAANQPLCLCTDRFDVPHGGLTYGMWEPARLIELVRAPGCSPALGGIKARSQQSCHRPPFRAVRSG